MRRSRATVVGMLIDMIVVRLLSLLEEDHRKAPSRTVTEGSRLTAVVSIVMVGARWRPSGLRSDRGSGLSFRPGRSI